MSYLKARTPLGKLRRFVRILHDYCHFYTHYQGWRSYTWMDGGTARLAGFRCRAAHRELFCADPFLFRYQEANWLFYETVNKKGKGMIGVMKEVGGEWVDQGIVLEEPFHLSYPQVFEYEGNIYMVPESSDHGGGCVSLYTTTSFPLGWRKVQTLIDQPFADATLLHDAGHWYMACYTIPPHETAELWHAPTLWGPWERHPQWRNINQSNRLRRCGGSFIRRGKDLYRVAQDCNRIYGKRMFLVKIDEISPTEYHEGAVTLLHDKTMKPHGLCHTYNELIVDGRCLHVVDVHYDSLISPLVTLKRFVGALARKLRK